jgi:hypothetical protein
MNNLKVIKTSLESRNDNTKFKVVETKFNPYKPELRTTKEIIGDDIEWL